MPITGIFSDDLNSTDLVFGVSDGKLLSGYFIGVTATPLTCSEGIAEPKPDR